MNQSILAERRTLGRFHFVKILILGFAILQKTSASGDEQPRESAHYVACDLQSKAKMWLDQDFHLRGNNLKVFRRGKQTLGGVEFFIGEKYIHLVGKRVPDYPELAEGIPVGLQAARIHFLQAGGWGTAMADDIAVGEYRFHYDDMTSETVKIINGQHLRDWWMFSESHAKNAPVVWNGLNLASKDYQGSRMRLQLFRMTWENPHPEKKIVTFDFESYNNSICSPFLLAASAEIRAIDPAGNESRAGDSAYLQNASGSDSQLSSRDLSDVEDSEQIEKLREIGAFLQSDGSRKLIKVSLSGPGPRAGKPRGTDANVAFVAQVPSVEFLDLAWSNITNDALMSVNAMPSLRSLNLNLTQVNDTGLGHLNEIKSLERLWLHRTKITNDGIEVLSQMPNLRVLDLSGTQISDQGLDKLMSLKRLEDLDLRETTTTQAGVAALRRVFPATRIRH